jgi:hypothetical protein
MPFIKVEYDINDSLSKDYLSVRTTTGKSTLGFEISDPDSAKHLLLQSVPKPGDGFTRAEFDSEYVILDRTLIWKTVDREIT